MSQITGIFGGSFNPIHIGHLLLANHLCEFGGLDEFWFMVSPRNPLKQQDELLDDEERLKLVKLATQEYGKFRVSDFEFGLPRPSYTVDTLRALRKAYPERDFRLIIGADNWEIFHLWKDHGQILAENRLLVYPRPGYHIDETTLPPRVELVRTPLLEVGSTFLREAIRQGKDVRYYLHPAVYRRIKEKKLYI